MAAVTEGRRLVGTGEAARYLGVDRSALGRRVAAGIVTPARNTSGGQYGWDLAELDRQLEEHQVKGDEPRRSHRRWPTRRVTRWSRRQVARGDRDSVLELRR